MKWEFKLQVDPNLRKAELDIYDVVGDPWFGATGQSVLFQLRNMDVDDLVVRVNSVGGSVTDGFDIFNLISEHPAKRKVARISGIAASIASIIPLACNSVEMYANSQYMIHDPYAVPDPYGPPLREADLRRAADNLVSMKNQMIDIYVKKTGRDAKEIEALCTAETWMTAKVAKDLGFVDRVLDGGENQMLVAARAWSPQTFARYRNTPKQVLQIAATAQTNPNQANQRKPMARRKVLNRVAMASAKALSLGALSATLAALSASLKGVKASDDGSGISDEELDALRSELEESSNAATELEEELKASREKCEEYDRLKSELEETKGRASKASEELEEVKKTMEALKSSGEGDDDAKDEDKEMDAQARTKFHSSNRRALRAVARVAMEMTGCTDIDSLEGALMALATKPRVNPQDVRAKFVDQLIANGKLMPSKKAWALACTEANLNTYLEGVGEARFTASAEPGANRASAIHERTPGAQHNSIRPPKVAAKGAAVSAIASQMGTSHFDEKARETESERIERERDSFGALS